MNTRLKRLLPLAAIGVVLLLIAQFGLVPLVRYGGGMESRLEAAEQDLSRVTNLILELELLRKAENRGGGKARTQGLFAELEALVRQLGMTKYVESMRPSVKVSEGGAQEEEVQVQFKAMTQRDFVRYMYEVEVARKGITTAQLEISKNPQNRFDVKMTLSAKEVAP